MRLSRISDMRTHDWLSILVVLLRVIVTQEFFVILGAGSIGRAICEREL